jgi:flagellar motor switch protein FliN/FliY
MESIQDTQTITASAAAGSAAAVSETQNPKPQVEVSTSKENPEEAIQRVKYPALVENTASPALGNIDYLKDVNLEASVELGSANLTVEKVLNLGVGAVVELSQNVGDPVRLVINHNLYALGEVVVIGDKFGVRITKLVHAA